MLFSIIAASFIFLTALYAIISPDIYVSTVSLKVAPPKGNILGGVSNLQDIGYVSNDRYIANEIETIYSSNINYEVAKVMVDSFRTTKNMDDFSLIFDKNYFQKKKGESLKPIYEIAGDLYSSVEINQNANLDFIDIKSESESPYEAALIANMFAQKYQEYNLRENRKQITIIKEFLGEQLKEKQQDLFEAEDAIKAYQLKKGGVELDKQAQLLINRLSDFESQRNTAKIEMSISQEKLNQYKSEIKEKDPSIYNFLANKSSEPYLQNLQKEIANLETQRDIALASSKTSQARDQIITDFNAKINSLKDKLNSSIIRYQEQILSSSPEEIKELTKKAFEEEVNYRSLNASYTSLEGVISNYEEKFNLLPSTTLEFARLERKRQFEENIYNTLSAKYQEAQLNEQATLGNVVILNKAYPPGNPSKPNRPMIIIMGFILGFGFGFGFIYLKDYLNKKVKSPEDIESQNLKLLTWIPKIKFDRKNEEFFMLTNPNNLIGESFRTLRTRIQFSKTSSNAKSFLVTSSAPGEGKTMTALNLGGSFARDNKKTIIVDCDLRKPRIHSIVNETVSPGLSEYLVGKVPFESIIRMTKLTKLDFVFAGSINSSTSEILNSKKMTHFLQKLRDIYDIIILDSAPILAVPDTEILSNFVDASLLVVSSNNTEMEWIKQAGDLLKHEQSAFLGVVLNNYDFKTGYPSSYKYYGYYSSKKITKN